MAPRENVTLPSLRDLFPEFVPAQGQSHVSARGQITSTARPPTVPTIHPTNTVHPGTPVLQRGNPPLHTINPAGQPNTHSQSGQVPPTIRTSRSAPDSDRAQAKPSAGRLHTHDVRPYTCDICVKTFSRPSALDTHMNSHTGDKPFRCDFAGCDRYFSTKSNMRRHSHSHSHNPAHVSQPHAQNSGTSSTHAGQYDSQPTRRG